MYNRPPTYFMLTSTSLYLPSVGHQTPANVANATTPYRRPRSATERFRFLRRAASSEPPTSPSMTTASQAYHGSSPKISEAPNLNTIPDPRAPSPMNGGNRSPSSPGPQHPDLSNEVAALSAKLINAINNLTNLDSTLQESQHELEEARAYIAHLEKERDQHRQAIASGALIRRVEIEKKEQRLERQMAEEQQKRNSAERQKKGMESELENLTGQLFEEANAMVAAARHEKQEAERKADMYRTKFEDTEVLLASQQAQLQQLKDVMHEERKKPRDSIQSTTTAPPTPVVGGTEKVSSSTFNYPTHTRNALSAQSFPPPESPLHFNHLIHPVVRTDVQSYEDFVSLLRTTKGSTPLGRSSSGSYAGLNVLGLGAKELGSQSTVIPSLRSAMTTSRSTSTPTPSGNNSPRPDDPDHTTVALKDTKYFKRALVEDIEPTLRLDTAPSLSWLARRGVLSSITSGRLIVEPYPQRHAFHSPAYACALCGEARTSTEHIRRYRFRASDNDEAQRYPVCDYCLARLRSTCDFTSFLRMAKQGVMKNETVDDCRVAWEECIKLREKMFWSRVGGGVIPAPGSNPGSPIQGPLSEIDKELTTPASRSDSDLASISRADSQGTASSEQPEVTSLSDAAASDQTRARETLSMDEPTSSTSKGPTRKQGTSFDRHKHHADGPQTALGASMPPSRLPEPRPAQSGSQDTDVAKRMSTSSSRPSSSAASSKAFFEAKSMQSQEGQTLVSPVVTHFKRPPVPSSNFRPSSSHERLQPSPVESASGLADAPQPLRRGSNTLPRPSSSKSTKSFSFGPRDGKYHSSVTDDSDINDIDVDGRAVLERLAPRTISSVPATAPVSTEQNAKMSAVSYLGAIFTAKPSRPMSRRAPDSEGQPQSTTSASSDFKPSMRFEGAAEDVTNLVTENALSKLAMGSELAAIGLPGGLPSAVRGTPSLNSPHQTAFSTFASAPTPEPALASYGRSTSVLLSAAASDTQSEGAIAKLPPSSPQPRQPSPRVTPRTSVSESQPLDSPSHLPKHFVAEPAILGSDPSTPAQTPKRTNKIAALASKFGGDESVGQSPPALGLAATPPPLKRPDSSSSEAFKRPNSSGSGLRSTGASPDRKGWPEGRRKSIVESALEGLGSPERLGRRRDGGTTSERENGFNESKSRGGSGSRGVSPIKIPGAFA